MKIPPLDLDPESWRRCIDCDGKLVHVSRPGILDKHPGHRFTYARGFHIFEYLLVLLRLL